MGEEFSNFDDHFLGVWWLKQQLDDGENFKKQPFLAHYFFLANRT